MKRVPMFGVGFVAAAVAAGSLAFAQAAPPAKPQDTPKPAAESKAPQAAEKVTVIFLGNTKCPTCDKPVDRSKFVAVEGQNVYTCCDKCSEAAKKDAKATLAKAYPTSTPISAKSCCCGSPIEAGKATEVAFQGHKVSLCGAECATAFKKDPVTAIAIAMHPGVKDQKNATDPIDGKPIDSTVVAIYKTHLIHFSSFANAATFEKDPASVVSKLKLSG
jgi:YHS domain-containing protein